MNAMWLTVDRRQTTNLDGKVEMEKLRKNMAAEEFWKNVIIH
jgi:hypothetical protein